MGYCLGIDGGGTGCRAALADETGRLLGFGTAGPANVRSDTEGTWRNIMAAVEQACAGQRVTLAEVTAVLGLAGANVSEAAQNLAAMLPFGRMQIVSDGLTATRGALGGRDGIVAALGTGSVFSCQYQGVTRQVGGRGFVLGDEGSGAVLGRALLADVLRADDGLIEMTPLLAEVLAEFAGGEAVIAWSFAAAPADFAALAPRIVASDDPAAAEILRRAVAQVRCILDRLQPEGQRLPVVFIGGLGQIYAARLQEDFEILAPVGSALDGAVAMAIALAQAPS